MMKRNTPTKGIQSMLDICPHCSKMTYIIQSYHIIMFCIFCNHDMWPSANRVNDVHVKSDDVRLHVLR